MVMYGRYKITLKYNYNYTWGEEKIFIRGLLLVEEAQTPHSSLLQ